MRMLSLSNQACLIQFLLHQYTNICAGLLSL